MYKEIRDIKYNFFRGKKYFYKRFILTIFGFRK